MAVSAEDARRERCALLDVLIVEHRERARTAESRMSSIQTTVGAVATGVIAAGAFIAPRLPYGRFATAEKVLLVVSAFAAIGVVVVWVDSLGGPTKGALKSLREATEEAERTYNKARPSLHSLTVRVAVLERLRAEEELARRALKPREESLQMACWLAVAAIAALTIVGSGLLF